jgi:hypothetical protein
VDQAPAFPEENLQLNPALPAERLLAALIFRSKTAVLDPRSAADSLKYGNDSEYRPSR